MWNPFKKKQIGLTPKYTVNRKTVELVKHKYNITIKMQNGEIFKTELFDDIYDHLTARYCLLTGELAYSDIYSIRLLVNDICPPEINVHKNWRFNYQGTEITLNSGQISWVQYTKIPFETVQVENEVLELIEETTDDVNVL